MNFLTRFSLKNPVAIFIFATIFLLGGLYSFSLLKVNLLPDVTFPQLTVQAVYPGASPDSVNKKVTSPLEKQFESANNLKSMQSSTYESVGIINLTFPFGTNMDDAKRQINKLITQAQLPTNASTDVSRFSFGTIPIYNISLFAKGNTNIDQLVNNNIIPEIKRIPGVNSVSVGGTKDTYLDIIVNKDKAKQYGLSLNTIQKAIQSKFISFPAGSITKSDVEIPVRVEESLKTINKLKTLQVKSNFAPAQTPAIKLGDIATIKTINEKSEYTRYNLKNALSMAISKKQSANTVQVSDQVMKVLNKYHDKMDYAVGFGQAEGIKKSVDSLMREGLLGALFASLAVLLFLRNFRATVIAIISIPLSLLIGAIFLNYNNITLNVMTLGGMAVAVGRVVDDSIVVIENIYRRIRKSNDNTVSDHLVQESTKEILKAITSSTITTIVVFLPLGFVGGITGEFFLPFALTIVFSLLASLLVAVTIVPILAKSSFQKVVKKPEKKDWIFTLQGGYRKLVNGALNHKAIAIIISILLLGGSLLAVPSLGFTFLPSDQQRIVTATLQLPAATALNKTNNVSFDVEKVLHNDNNIKDISAAIGSRDYRTGVKKPNVANYFITIKDNVNMSKEIKTLKDNMKHIISNQAPGSIITVQEQSSGGPPSNNDVNIDLYSNDMSALEAAASHVEAYMKKQSDLKYVKNNFSDKQKQWVIHIDPQKTSEYGVSDMTILGMVNDQTKPITMDQITIGNQSAIKISYNKAITSINQLKNIQIYTPKGPLKLSALATVNKSDTYTSIQKLNGKVFARVSAQAAGNNIQKVTAKVKSDVKKDVKIPSNVSYQTGGGSDQTIQTFQQLGLAMLVAIGLVYLTMLITFGKARIPFVVLTSLLFVPIGAILGLLISGESLSVSAMIGMLMLIGIVTTNAIVFIDRIGQNREQKEMTIREAILEAGQTRLRPILMTAFATIAALIPLALTKASGTLISKGLAVVVIGGLTSATLLTLVLLPVFYELFFIRTARKERRNI